MATIITVTTGACPVQVTTVDTRRRQRELRGSDRSVQMQLTTIETVPPNSEASFPLTASGTITFDELADPNSRL